MTREFVSTKIFDKRWEEMGLTDNDLRKLEDYIMQNPFVGDIMEGTGGAVKLRFPLPDLGKRSGARIIFIDLIKSEKVYLITCYPKSRQDNLTDREKAAIKEAVKSIIKNESEGL